MNPFYRYLWKEWREQRVTLATLAGVLVALAGAGGILLPRRAFADPMALGVCGSLGMLAVLLLIGGEVFSAETVGAPRRFLERIPAGTGTAFWAKMVFVAGTLLGGALWGWVLALVVCFWRTGAWPYEGTDLPTIVLLLPVLVLGAWAVAVASWVPRGSLALPLGLLVVLLGNAPFVVLFQSWGYRPGAWEVLGVLGLNLLGALAVARTSFTEGRRFGRGAGHAAFQGGKVGAIFLIPLLAWGGWHVRTLFHVDPAARGSGVAWARLSEDGRHLVVAAIQEHDGFRSRLEVALIADIETGEWHRLGPLGSGLRWGDNPDRVELLARDGKPLGWIDPFDAHLVSAPLPTGAQRVRTSSRTARRIYDGYRDAAYDPAVILPSLSPGDRLFIGQGAWAIAWQGGGHGSCPAPEHAWSRYDPDTAELSPLDWPEDGASVHSRLLPFGRVPILSGGCLFLGDPQDGSLLQVQVEGEFAGHCLAEWPRYGGVESELDPGVVIVTDTVRLFRLDLERAELVPLGALWRRDSVVGVVGSEALLLVECDSDWQLGRRVVRLDLSNMTRTVLFPRAGG